MLAKVLISLIVAGGLAGLTLVDDDLDGVKCVVNGKADAKKENAVKYRDGEVYFCCKNCPKEFEADSEKYATSANSQLVATGQYVQKACPLMGKPVNEEMVAEVNGVKVGFCCARCKGRVEAAEGTAQAELVFSNAAFEKGFEKHADDDDDDDDDGQEEMTVQVSELKCPFSGQPASAEHAVSYHDGTVYFCCASCAKTFEKNPDKGALKANHQLVLSGQFVQKACPFSGGDVDETTLVSVGGAEVGFCCSSCQAKVEKAEGLDAKVELVFSSKAFDKGFEKKKP